jgi:hypothetical protein
MGSIHAFVGFKHFKKFVGVPGKRGLLSSNDYQLIEGTYPPKFAPYPPYKYKKHPLETYLNKLSLPVDPESKKAYLGNEEWHSFSPYDKNVMILNFAKGAGPSNIKLTLFKDNPDESENNWLWIEIPEDGKIKVMELPTKRFLDGKQFAADAKVSKASKNTNASQMRELCVYVRKLKGQRGASLILLEDCTSFKLASMKAVSSKVLGFFELSNKWMVRKKKVNWNIAYNRQDTYGVNIFSLKTRTFKSKILDTYANFKSKLNSNPG